MRWATCIGENRDADQLYRDCTADQRLCFHYTDSMTTLLVENWNFPAIKKACFFDCTGWFESDLIRNSQ